MLIFQGLAIVMSVTALNVCFLLLLCRGRPINILIIVFIATAEVVAFLIATLPYIL